MLTDEYGKKLAREQLIVALNVYCKIPFKNSSARHPMIKEYAQLIGRTPAALMQRYVIFLKVILLDGYF